MKSALIHDWLLSPVGGSENVLQEIHKLIPSPIFTLFANFSNLENSYFAQTQITPSFLQKIPFLQHFHRHLLPLFPMAIESLDVKNYDLILSSSHCVAKSIQTTKEQLHISYCHTPMRYAWDLQEAYLKDANLSSGIKGFLAKRFLQKIQKWDLKTANRPNFYIANSHFVKDRIQKFYHRDAKVIYPPVFIDRFSVKTSKDDYYITASRLVKNKKIDLIVDAFALMPDKKLVIIGDGPERKTLEKKASKNIEFLGYQPSQALNQYLQNAKAFVFAAIEDFGIAPVEAMATGTPVIALGIGGATESVIDRKTGLFFNEQTEHSLILAVKEFEKHQIDPLDCRKRAEEFSTSRFQKEFQEFIFEKYIDFKNGKL